jgi:hypothetical protein
MNLTQANRNKLSYEFFNTSTTNPINQNTMNDINNRLLSERTIRSNSTTNETSIKASIVNRIGGYLTSPPYCQLSNSQNNNNIETMFGSQNQFKYEMNTIPCSTGSFAKINNLQSKSFKQFDKIKSCAALSGSIFDANDNNNNNTNTTNYEFLIKEIEIIKNQFDDMKSCFVTKCKFLRLKFLIILIYL